MNIPWLVPMHCRSSSYPSFFENVFQTCQTLPCQKETIEVEDSSSLSMEFQFVKSVDGRYGIPSVRYGTFLRAHPGFEHARLNFQLDKHAWDDMLWEQFEIIKIADKTYAFQSIHGTYLHAEDVFRIGLDVPKFTRPGGVNEMVSPEKF